MYDKYLNRRFFYGKTDCASLSIEFLNNELNLDIKDFPRVDLHSNLNYLYNCCISNGFIDMNDKDNMNLKFGDVIISLYNNLPIHCSVYINDGNVLTITPFIKSSIIPIEEELKKHSICYHLRHETLLDN